MEPAERQEIIQSIQTEFKTFKHDVFKPMAESVKSNTDKNADQGEDIAENRGHIQTLKSDVKENRGSIWRLLLLVVGGLITILATFLTVYLMG